MKIKKSIIYSFLFIILILLQLYVVSYKISYIIQLFVLIILFFDVKIRIKKYFIYIFMFLFSLILLGFIGTFINKYEIIDIVKDFIFISKPLLSFTLAYIIANAIDNKEKFIRTIIYLGITCALIHFYILFFLVKFNTIHSIRDLTKDNFVELFALFFLIGYTKIFNKNFTDKKIIRYILIGLLIISSFFYFSRMTIIISVILILAYYGFLRINRINASILFGILFSILAIFTVLNNIQINRNSKGFEAFLFKIKNSQKEMLSTKIDVNNSQQLWDHWRGYEAKRALILMKETPYSTIIGCGNGSLINLRIMAPLTADSKGIRHISHIHNGYAFVFYKLGSLGLLIYLFGISIIFLIGQNKNNFLATSISSIAIIYFLTSFAITGIYNLNENIILILGGLIFYYSPSTKKTTI
ncbi:O-antigen ligase family protein [Empedobacter brevis]|uniref:O-antigen ligase family protein n=1 Tax=Empedobacter brevis TaxID=247 RepID=UPI0039B00340